MPRPASGWWDSRRKCYVAKLGGKNPETGRPGLVVLRYADGRPVAKGDQRGKLEALGRLLGNRDERVFVGPTVREVCVGFAAWCRDRGRAERTWKDHYANLRKWADLVGPDRPAAGVGTKDLTAWKKAGRKRYRQVAQSVKAAFGWAYRPIEDRVPERLIPTNPFDKFPIEASEPKDRSIPWDDARKILRLAWAYSQLRAGARIRQTRESRWLRWLCMVVIAWTGLRPKEAWGMRWDEWDGTAWCFVPDPARIKTRKARPAPVPPSVARLVERARRIAGDVYVFRDRASKAAKAPDPRELFRWVREELKPFLAEHAAGLPAWTLYSLRHGYFTDAVGLAGLDAETAAHAGGNSAPVLRARYLGVQAGQVRATNRRIWAARRKRGG